MEKLNEIKFDYSSSYIQSLIERREALIAELGIQCESLCVRSDDSITEFRKKLAYIVQLDTEITLIGEFLSTQPVQNLGSEA